MTGSGNAASVAAPSPRRPADRRTSSYQGYLSIAAAAFLWGISASLGRAAFTGRLLPGLRINHIDPLILSQARTTGSCLLVAPWLIFRRGVMRLRLPGHDLWRLFWLGLAGVAVSNYFYYLAIARTTVATAIIVQYTAPIWVLLYMFARGAERPTARKIASVILAVTGIALVIGIFDQRMRLDSIGVLAALIAAFSFAYYNIGGHFILKRYDRWTVLFYTTLAASLFWLVVNPPTKVLAAHYTAMTWLFLGVFSLVSVLLPFAFYFAGLERLEPTKAIIASCLEPVFSILIAAVALQEVIRPLQGVGIMMVLSAIVLVQTAAGDRAESMPGPVD